MKKVLFVISIFLMLSSPFGVQATEHSKLAVELADALGLNDMLLTSKLQAQKSAEQQFSQIINQFQQSIPDMPAQYMEELKEVGSKFVREVSMGWDESEAARIYSSALADSLPEDELRKAIDHYQTPQGQTELRAINEASAKLSAYILSSTQRSSQKATNEFINNLRLIVEKAKRDRETRNN